MCSIDQCYTWNISNFEFWIHSENRTSFDSQVNALGVWRSVSKDNLRIKDTWNRKEEYSHYSNGFLFRNGIALRWWVCIPDGRGPRVVVSTAAFHARARGSVPGLGGLKETKMFLPHPRVKVSIVGNLRDREVACSASDRQGSNFESCVWRTVSSQSSHHPQEVLLAQFSLYVHKGGLKPDSFHLYPRHLQNAYFMFV